jgi:hypothetical protein
MKSNHPYRENNANVVQFKTIKCRFSRPVHFAPVIRLAGWLNTVPTGLPVDSPFRIHE